MKEGVEKILLSKNKMLLAFCFCFIAGAGSFSLLNTDRFLMYAYVAMFGLAASAIMCWHKKYIAFILACICVFLAGGCRFLITIPHINSSSVYAYYNQKLTIEGFVNAEPYRGIGEAQFILRATRLQEKDKWRNVSGNILLKTKIYPEYMYGEALQMECVLQEPKNIEGSGFNYKKYLAKQNVWSVCGNPKIKSLGGNKGNRVVMYMLTVKNIIAAHIAKLWPEPDSSLLAGILYGSRSGLPKQITDNFSRTGVSHIVAVSGYNVTIMVVALNTLLIYAGLFRRQSFWFLVCLVGCFVFFTGASASVVRAGIMALLTLVSQHIGRMSAISRALIYAAVVMMIFNPYVLLWDAGFQLSFLATIGLVYIAPIFQRYAESVVGAMPAFIQTISETFFTTMAAIVATLPLIMHQFGRFSVSAPLVNILVLWIIPMLMLFGFVGLVLSFIFFPLGQAVAWCAWLGTRYVIMVVDWFGRQAWSALEVHIPFWAMILLYSSIIYIIVREHKKQKIFVWQKK